MKPQPRHPGPPRLLFFTLVPPGDLSGYGQYTATVVKALSEHIDTSVRVVGRRSGFVQVLRVALTAASTDVLAFNHYETGRWIPWIPGRAKTIYASQNPEYLSDSSAASLEPTWARRMLRRTRARLRRHVEGRILRSAAAVTVICDDDAHDLEKVHERAFHVLRPAYQLPARSSARKSGDGLHVGLVGTFHWTPKRLNAEWIIRECLVPLAEEGVPVTLTLAGSGAGKVALPSTPCRLRTRVIEHFDSPTTIYATLDAALTPERQVGGIKLKTIEALLHGVPVIGSPESFRGVPLPAQAGRACRTPRDYLRALHELNEDQGAFHIGAESVAALARHFSSAASAADAALVLADIGIPPGSRQPKP